MTQTRQPVAIRAGSKGCDSNLPASYHQDWQQGLWLEPASYKKLLKSTGENVAESPHAQIDNQGGRYSVVDFNTRLIQLIVSVDSISCALSLWCWCAFIFFVLDSASLGLYTSAVLHVCTLIWILTGWLIDILSLLTTQLRCYISCNYSDLISFHHCFNTRNAVLFSLRALL